MSNKVLITNSQKAVKVPSGLRILSAVPAMLYWNMSTLKHLQRSALPLWITLPLQS